jgi:hypothetical protein
MLSIYSNTRLIAYASKQTIKIVMIAMQIPENYKTLRQSFFIMLNIPDQIKMNYFIS